MARFFYRLLVLTGWRAARWYLLRRYKMGRFALWFLAAAAGALARRAPRGRRAL
jgi:hypothetical protein